MCGTGVGGVGLDPACLCVSGCAGRWSPGTAAGAGSAEWAGADAARTALGRVSALRTWGRGGTSGLSSALPHAPRALDKVALIHTTPEQTGAPGHVQADPGGHQDQPPLPWQQPGH